MERGSRYQNRVREVGAEQEPRPEVEKCSVAPAKLAPPSEGHTVNTSASCSDLRRWLDPVGK